MSIHYSEINQYGYLVHEVTTFMDMILMARCEENDWNRTMFLCSNFADFWAWSVVLCFFSYTNYLAFVSPRIHLYLDNLDYVRNVINQQAIHRSTQCFIDGQENNNVNLALEFEQCVELFYFKKVSSLS